MASSCGDSLHPGDISAREAEIGILPSHGISLDVPGTSESGRPTIVHHLYVAVYCFLQILLIIKALCRHTTVL